MTAERVRRRRVLAGLGCACVTLALLAGSARPAAAPPEPVEPLVIGHLMGDSALVNIHQQVVSEACRRAGLAVAYRAMPLVRLMESTNSGEIDGDLFRIADITKRYPNVMIVPTPTGRVDVAVYGASPAIAAMTRAQIATLRLGAPRGVLVIAKHAEGLATSLGSDYLATGRMVLGGRIDAMFAAHIDMESARLGGALPGLFLWPHRWAAEPLHLVLNKRHAGAAERIDRALREMKREGLIDHIYDDEVRRRGIQELAAD